MLTKLGQPLAVGVPFLLSHGWGQAAPAPGASASCSPRHRGADALLRWKLWLEAPQCCCLMSAAIFSASEEFGVLSAL